MKWIGAFVFVFCLLATCWAKEITLEWDAPSDTSNITGYYIYMESGLLKTPTANATQYDAGNSTNHTITITERGRYSFWATSYNATLESAYSNRANYVRAYITTNFNATVGKKIEKADNGVTLVGD